VLGLGQTTDKLARYRRRWEQLMARAKQSGAAEKEAPQTRLREHVAFGSNPGNLRMFTYAPKRLQAPPALVVVLHGCTQTAAGYDHGTGWSALADRLGFVVLLPEQRRANNPNTCFNWFSPEDTTRDHGEALSIRAMIEHAVLEYGIDRSRIYVTGLSAGGAMTSVMLATYPEVFAGGAIIAGLPYGSASNVQEAFDAMFQATPRPARAWGDRARAASHHRGRWPKVSVWHGGADTTVKPANADEIVKQWTELHGLGEAPAVQTIADGHRHRIWRNAAGEDVLELHIIAGMAHGVPIAPSAAGDSGGNAGPFILDVGIPSTLRIAQFWGLAEAEFSAQERTHSTQAAAGGILIDEAGNVLREPEPFKPQAGNAEHAEPKQTDRFDPGAVIAKALRAAGLMK
jgi:feruloyl esterase